MRKSLEMKRQRSGVSVSCCCTTWMAYAALASLAQTIHLILLNHQRCTFFQEFNPQIKHLLGQSTFLRDFLDDFPEGSDGLQGRIRDVANEAEDAIEDFLSKHIHPHLNSGGRSQDVQFAYLQSGEPTASGQYMLPRRDQRRQDETSELYQKLQKVTNEIDSIIQQVIKTKKRSKANDQQFSDSSSASSSSGRFAPRTGKDVVVGFEEDLMTIKDRLCGQSAKLQVVPIFGMGGIGKTTLARNAYDDRLTMEHFQIRAWVTISQDYSIQEILSNLLVSIKPSDKNQQEQDDELMGKVYKGLKGMRYLIVMDDMWSTKAWDDLKMIFPDDDNGSRIIVTTRLFDVATYANFPSSNPPHEMHFLDEDQSWNLLQQMVFKQEGCPVELEKIGNLIATSCGGLPLAIVVIAGLLSTVDRTQASWENIAQNVNINVMTNYEQFAKILSLSYIHLPQHLRQCVLYMGGFPEDYEIQVWKLIKLWVAEGFLKPSTSKIFEEVAEEYLEDLVKRSLVLVTKRKTNGKIKSCSIHDLVRDLCIRIAHEEKFLHRYIGDILPTSIRHQRRINFARCDLRSLEYMYGSTTRTIICFHCRNSGSSQLSLFRNFRLLRVLDVVNSVGLKLLPEVLELFHLRYLAVNHRMKFPNAISNLQNLQTLIIHPGKAFKSYEPFRIHLPLKIWRIPQLRHMVSFVFDFLPHPGEATLALENLQTLSEIGDFKCTAEILRMIPNLKKLGISYFGGQNDQDYHLNNLVHLHQLEKLKIKIHPTFLFRRKLNPAFPPSLKKLTLSGLQRPWEAMGIIGSLPNLEVLKLRDYAFRGHKWETNEEEFCCLKFLLIDKSDLQDWITERNHFPNLKCLVLYRCWCLKDIPDGFGEIEGLELIKIDDANSSLMDSARQIQEVQQGWGNDAFQIRIGRYNTLTGDIK
ncbi:putative late blight resistance proteinR1B-16 [Sesamum alatum]|uniref:Late blight resistance proteinR1B-16 n=1 Tax=Sesamum alatum TaxID=300844 RepID=A0AAE1YMD2_9LAMI|nr:putative late blight resistance proteinR1B-16 [Sesamum alatum]